MCTCRLTQALSCSAFLDTPYCIVQRVQSSPSALLGYDGGFIRLSDFLSENLSRQLFYVQSGFFFFRRVWIRNTSPNL